MDESEQRQIARDSLFVMADMRLDETGETHRIKVRNLSSGGLMGEGPVRVYRGAQVWVDIRNVGWTEGTIAWVHENRFGVAFRDEIDPKVARLSRSESEESPMIIKAPPASRMIGGVLRKV